MNWDNKIKMILNCSVSKYSVSKENEFVIADLESHFDEERPAYIYFVISRCRVTINPDYLIYDDKFIEFELLIQNRGKIIRERLKHENWWTKSKKLKIVSDFPYNSFKLTDENETDMINGKAYYLAELLWNQIENKELLDYHVKYIGQSIASDNNVPVIDRVSSHDKYQKIQTDYSDSHPDKELQFLFCSLKLDSGLEFPDSPIERESFISNFTDLMTTPSKENRKQQITLIEAALINYFKPEYNTDYKYDYPNPKHKGYNKYYNVNLKTLAILIGLTGLSPKLYTETINRNNEFRFSFDFAPE